VKDLVDMLDVFEQDPRASTSEILAGGAGGIDAHRIEEGECAEALLLDHA
jgi:hypothetical protein